MDGKKLIVLPKAKIARARPFRAAERACGPGKRFYSFFKKKKKIKKYSHIKWKQITRENGKNFLQDDKNYYARK